LKKLLPLIHQIIGDFSLTAQCLEYILKEKVKIAYSPEVSDDITLTDLHHSGVVGKSLLGIDTISGNLDYDFVDRLLFSIGPIVNNITDELVKDGSVKRFLDCFYSYFIPFELEVDTKFIFGTEQSLFMLNEEADTAITYLGYNSVIQ
jgi:hypothetical protein